MSKKIAARCGVKSSFILYFYTTAHDCPDCEKQGLVLTALREKYPELRVYSFDYGADTSAVQAMVHIYKIKGDALPALVVDDELLKGFHGTEDLDARITESFKLQAVEPVVTDGKKPATATSVKGKR